MAFDPYHKWLGIPSGRRPPTYYELLGIEPGENDNEVIHSALAQRRAFVRSKKGEGRDEEVKAILRQFDEAASTLLVPEFKASYDRQIGLHLKGRWRRGRRSYLLPSWMESSVVRIYGEGSGIVGDVLGIVAVIFVAIALMLGLSYFVYQPASDLDPVSVSTWMEKAGAPNRINKEPQSLETNRTEVDPSVASSLSQLLPGGQLPVTSDGNLNGPSGDSQSSEAREFTNSVGMKLIRIPAGTFMMGSPATEKGREDNEVQHSVELTRDFYLGTTEVTQGQWVQLMETTPWKGKKNVKEGSNIAATYVSWNDAEEFCKRLSAKEVKTYRLPTEAEWEYACRGGTMTAYSFGSNEANLSEYGWWSGSFSDGNVESEHAYEVGVKRANPFGLFDMHGNVWEWCSDWRGDYPTGSVSDPLGPSQGTGRVDRGGGWGENAVRCRSAIRSSCTPNFRIDYLGFRVASDAPGKPMNGNSTDRAFASADTTRNDQPSFENKLAEISPRLASSPSTKDKPVEPARVEEKKIQPAVPRVGATIEGENLKVLTVTRGNVEPQGMGGFPADKWSGDWQLFWTGGKPKDRLIVELPVEKAGKFDLLMVLTKAQDYAIVQVWLDDKKLGAPLDLYNNTEVVTTGLVKFGVHDLTAGKHTLTFEITGANIAAAKKFMVGIDAVQLGLAKGRLPKSSDGAPLNLNFEKGTLDDWVATGIAFKGQPISRELIAKRRPETPNGQTGNYWISTCEPAGDDPRGTLTSAPFKLDLPYASFLVGGGQSPETRVELVAKARGNVLARFSGRNTQSMQLVIVDLKAHLGKEIYIRIVDNARSGWGHINFDDFQLHAEQPGPITKR